MGHDFSKMILLGKEIHKGKFNSGRKSGLRRSRRTYPRLGMETGQNSSKLMNEFEKIIGKNYFSPLML